MTFALMLGVLACGEGQPEPTAAPEAAAPQVTPAAPDPAAPAALPLTFSLNEGARWQADPSTRQVMAETAATLARLDPATVEQARALGDALDEQLTRLVSGCTMEGPAHAELHVFLKHWMPTVGRLRQAQTLAAAQVEVTALRGLLSSYQQAFE